MITPYGYKEMIEKIAGVAAEYGFYQYKDRIGDTLWPEMPGRTHELMVEIYLSKGCDDSAEAPPAHVKPSVKWAENYIRAHPGLTPADYIRAHPGLTAADIQELLRRMEEAGD